MEELVRLGKLDATYIATDFFDASINRVVAWVTGLRNTRKAILAALLQPVEAMKKAERDGDVSTRLAMVQEFKAGAMLNPDWDYSCAKKNAGVGLEWLQDVKQYEAEVLSKR